MASPVSSQQLVGRCPSTFNSQPSTFDFSF
jgi:hypothetical protein